MPQVKHGNEARVFFFAAASSVRGGFQNEVVEKKNFARADGTSPSLPRRTNLGGFAKIREGRVYRVRVLQATQNLKLKERK